MSNTKSVHEVRMDVFAAIEEMRKGDFKAHLGDQLDNEYSEALNHLRKAHVLLHEIETTPVE